MRGLFVTATDTGVGKTVLSAALLAAMAAAGEPVAAFKPVVTGLADEAPGAPGAGCRLADEAPGAPGAGCGLEDEAPGASAGSWPPDHELLGMAAGMDAEAVAPLRFGPAASPHLAAALAGVRIDPRELLASARRAGADGSTLVVEGVGGLLVPFDGGFLVRDLAGALGLAVLIAARPGLGTINHTLLTLAAARAAGLHVRAVVITPWPRTPGTIEESNRHTIARLGTVEVAGLPAVSRPGRGELAAAGEQLPWRRWLDG